MTVAILVATCVLRGGSIYRYLLAHDRPSTLLAPPYMRLEALLEEPLGYGWGVDITGHGPSLNLSSLQVDPALELKILQNNFAGSHSEASHIARERILGFKTSQELRNCPI